MFTSSRVKYTLLLWISLVMVFSGFSQEIQQAKKTRKGEFIGIARGGIVASQIYNDDFGGYNKLGGTGGFGVQTYLGQNRNKFQFEINFAMRGSRQPADPDNGDVGFKLAAHYIDFPILYSGPIGKFDYELGLVNSVLVYSNIQDNGVQIDFLSNGMGFNRYELGGLVGINLELSENWKCNVRFQHSITPALGRFYIVNGFNITGGAFNNAVSFALVRVFNPK